MNPNYTEFKFPQIKAHPWSKVFSKRLPQEAIDLVRSAAPGLLAPWPASHGARCCWACQLPPAPPGPRLMSPTPPPRTLPRRRWRSCCSTRPTSA
jgi:hypothetical protein